MVSAAAMATARHCEQDAVERQEAALGIRLQQPQNPPGNIIAGNIIAGAVEAAIEASDQALDPPNAAAAAAKEGDNILAATNLDIDDDDYQQPPPEPLPPLIPPVQHNAYAIHESWTMPRDATYEGALRHFMSFVHQRIKPYPKDTKFTYEQFMQLQPEPGHIHDYLAYKVFAKVDLNYNAGDRPTHYRSSSMEIIKNLSFFHPNRNIAWCNGQAKPT